MGYKTIDPEEVMNLQKEGHSVIGIHTRSDIQISIVNGVEVERRVVLPGLIYEFDFNEKEKEQPKEVKEAIDNQIVKNILINESEVVKVAEKPKEKKKRGRPRRTK